MRSNAYKTKPLYGHIPTLPCGDMAVSKDLMRGIVLRGESAQSRCSFFILSLARAVASLTAFDRLGVFYTHLCYSLQPFNFSHLFFVQCFHLLPAQYLRHLPPLYNRRRAVCQLDLLPEKLIHMVKIKMVPSLVSRTTSERY